MQAMYFKMYLAFHLDVPAPEILLMYGEQHFVSELSDEGGVYISTLFKIYFLLNEIITHQRPLKPFVLFLKVIHTRFFSATAHFKK